MKKKKRSKKKKTTKKALKIFTVKAGTILGKKMKVIGWNFCEGMYECQKDGTVFSIGTRSRIGFEPRHDCPGSTTLPDGSVWNLIPGSCSCD